MKPYTLRMKDLLPWIAALLIALLLSSTYLLDGPSELQAAQDVAADLHDAITLAQVRP